MKRKLLLMMASLLLAGAVSAQQQSWWTTSVNTHERSSNTPIVAAISIDGDAQTDFTNLTLGAFASDGLRGTTYNTNSVYNNQVWIQVYYDFNTTEAISFKLYDATTQTEYTTCTVTPPTTTQDEGWGTPTNPVVLDFTATQTQSATLIAGWNWFAPTVEVSLDYLETSLGANGIIIRSYDGKYAMYDEIDEEWSGSLRSLIPGQMYKIRLASSCSPSLTGRPITNVTHSIVRGNNWFGYTNSQSMSIEDAFSNFSPVDGDRIKSSDGKYAMYDGVDEEWSGSLRNLVSGKGYIYVSQDPQPKDLVIPTNVN